ncbi:MAG TPA: efflux RND transporter permease subunit, partial [Tepidisphaeraceae bacterium]|jgi:HAE1 family hydrophobic/amphiphilic exporter-1
VDDAIVVVENVERNMDQFHLQPREATVRAMGEVFGPIIAISLVLMSVFGPAALLGGITGELYRQFALTIAASTFLSAVNALTLSPALCAILLKPHNPNKKPNFFNRGFNTVFGKITTFYRWIISGMIRFAPVSAVAFIGVMVATYLSLTSVPTGFLPLEDNGFFVTNVQLPDAASLERTTEVVDRVSTILKNTDGVAYNTGLPGFSLIAGNGSNNATLFATLKPWDERLPKGRTIEAIQGEVMGQLMQIQEAMAFTFQFPPIPGLGTSAGFDMRLLADANVSRERMQNLTGAIMGQAAQDPRLTKVFSSFRAGVPQFYVDIDREKVKKLGIPLQRVFDTLQASMGSAYVNDFNIYGRTFQVNVQADHQFRASASDVLKLEVKGLSGETIPMGSIATVTPSFGPDRVTRYNLYESAQVNGSPAPGIASGQSLDAIEQIFNQNKIDGVTFDWSAVSYQEKKTEGTGWIKAIGGQAVLVFAAGIFVVYLILAAQYESWTLPLSIALSVPLALIGAMGFLLIRGFDNNIYTQIGLVLLVGLSAKNAILIVEFARASRAEGKTVREAAIEAAVTRFRPILMTSFAFILGCVPLMLASGAGANSRQALGTAVVGGMLGATILGVLFIPLLYFIVQSLTERVTGRSPVQPKGEAEAFAHAGA